MIGPESILGSFGFHFKMASDSVGRKFVGAEIGYAVGEMRRRRHENNA